MTYFIQPIITKAGASNISAAIANKQVITFTRFSLGSGRIKTDIESATNVAKEVHTIAAAQTLDDAESPTFRILGRLDNTDIDTELTINEIGIFAKVGNGAEFMYMYTWAETGDIIPPGNAGNVYRDYDFATTISRDATVTIKFENPEQIYTTHAEMLAFEDIVNKKIDSIDINEVEKAKKLSNARTIALNGKATGSTTFDGSKNVSINVDIKTATTKAIGLVQLDDNANSTDTTKAATGHAVGVVNKAFSAHQSDNNKHITSSERTKWNGKADLNYTQTELGKKANKSVAQMYKLTQDNGTLTTLHSQDLRSIIDSGGYYCIRCTNAPKTGAVYQGHGYLYVARRNTDNCSQIFIEYLSSELFVREMRGDEWSDWRKLATDVDLSKKADIAKAQMYKLTQDGGESKRCSQMSLNDLTDPGHYWGWGLKDIPLMPANMDGIFVDVYTRNSYVIQIITHEFTGFRAWRSTNKDKSGWIDWQILATTTDLATVETDLTKATTVQLASGNNLNDYFDHNGKIAGINLVGAPLEMNGHNVIVECSSYTNAGSTQEITDLVTGVKMLRTYTSGKWTRWQKLGGIDAKIYDIVMSGGLKPYKNAKELDNKVVVYNGVAHLDLNVDNKSVTGTSRITIPKELAVRVKPESSLYDERAYLTAITTMGHYEGEGEWGVKHFTPESTSPTVALYFNINGDMSSATTLEIEKSIWDNKGKAENRIAHVSWYVGGVN